MARFKVPGIYINAKTKEFAVFQDRRTSQFVIDIHKERIDMINNGFEYMCPVNGDGSISRSDGWAQAQRGKWTRQPKENKADALCYAEAVVTILKNELGE